MLSNARLGNKFWAEAVNTSMYLINRSPSTLLEFGIPEEKWLGKKIYYDYLSVFGCESFVHIPKEKRTKLDMKSKRCIFNGYGEETYGYRLWDPITKCVIRSRDVIFNQKVIPVLQGGGKSPKEYISLEDITNHSDMFKQKVIVNQPQPPVQIQTHDQP